MYDNVGVSYSCQQAGSERILTPTKVVSDLPSHDAVPSRVIFAIEMRAVGGNMGNMVEVKKVGGNRANKDVMSADMALD